LLWYDFGGGTPTKKVLASFVIAALILAGAGCASMNRTQKAAMERSKG